jgi:hypothetical protein
LEYVDFLDCTTNSVKVTNAASETSFLNCENFFVQYATVNPSDSFLIDGEYSEGYHYPQGTGKAVSGVEWEKGRRR